MSKDYEVKACKSDREFSSVEYMRDGLPGSVPALLAGPMPPTIGVVVGARGELSRSVKQYVSDCAEQESISPVRFGCYHGEDQQPSQQARGMIANFVNRAFGRVSLRGMARVRHAALTAATGSKQYAAGHLSSSGVWAENAWDSTGDRAQGVFTSTA